MKILSIAPIAFLADLLCSLTPSAVIVHGSHGKCHIPRSLVGKISRHIDARGIHRSRGDLRLDGSQLHRLSEQGIPGLSLVERAALLRAGDVGLESAAMSFDGDVYIADCPEDIIALSQQRGAATGFGYADTVLAMASQAVIASGRAPSGARIS